MTFPLFQALIEQTKTRGGSPSVDNLSDADRATLEFVAAYQTVRRAHDHMPSDLPSTLARADTTLAALLRTLNGLRL
jgi:hypothetical protein